jgi:hypothetical protein
LFFSTKNWEIVQFHLGQIFCSANFRWDSPIVPKNRGLGLLKYIIPTGGQIVSENSALEVKTPKTVLKTGEIKILGKISQFHHGQRRETLDLPYLTLLCDNLKNRMFLQNFFS